MLARISAERIPIGRAGYTCEKFPAQTMELNGGIGDDMIYDTVGKAAFFQFLRLHSAYENGGQLQYRVRQ